MKKRIWTWEECWRSEYSAAVRSASDNTLNQDSIVDSSSLKTMSSETTAISSSVCS